MCCNWPLLSLLIWLPILGGVADPDARQRARRSRRAGWRCGVALRRRCVLSIPLFTGFDQANAGMQFVEAHAWIPAYDIRYHLGADGISVALIVLTTLTTVLVLIGAWGSIDKRVSQYFAAFLILEGLMIGVFCALDAMLFYVFFEAMLIPMFIIIGVWGGPRRVYAAMKFFLYTFLGSVFMLVGLIYLYLKGGSWQLADLAALPLTMHGADVAVLRLPGRVRGQGADVPGAHLVAGRARRGADRRLGDPGGDHAEDRRIRLPALHRCRSCPTPATSTRGW